MFTLVVTNRKGGTAKTTTAVNLASEYARQGQRCLLIDLDAQGHSGLGLGIEPLSPEGRPQSILANGRQSLNSLLHETCFDNLFFIPPGQMPDTKALQKERLLNFLARKQLAYHFDIVVIDTPPNAGIEQSAALMSADAVVIPFMPSPLGKTSVQQLLHDMKNTPSKNTSRRIPFALIPIMLDPRVNLDNRILSEMISAHGTKKILRGVRRNVKLAEAFDAGQPVNIFAARSRGAFDYHMLAEDIAGLWPKMLPRQNPLSFRETAEIKTLPTIDRKNEAEKTPLIPDTMTHRGIRLKDKCSQWNG
jgi:chromosome partitioning protein